MALQGTQLKISELLIEYGPMTGSQLAAHLKNIEPVLLWKTCYQAPIFQIINCARYYLRYDITRDDMIRLSPSVLRDFLSFSLVYFYGNDSEVMEKAVILANKHRLISLKKLDFARNALLSLSPDILETINLNTCSFIAGDIAYFLAHEEPRIHKETGAKLLGSDIDIIVVYENDLDDAIIKQAESEILQCKHLWIKEPSIGQEIDFIFKPISTMLRQLSYEGIQEKIACKILYESFFLYGRLDIYEMLKANLQFSGVTKKIESDFAKALQGRKDTLDTILKLEHSRLETMDENTQSLFFFSQERLEFQ